MATGVFATLGPQPEQEHRHPQRGDEREEEEEEAAPDRADDEERLAPPPAWAPGAVAHGTDEWLDQ